MGDLRIVFDPHASESLKQYVRDNLDNFNMATTGRTDWTPVNFFLRAEHDEVVGGLLGNIWGGWMHVAYLWVSARFRGRGHGTSLLQAAETLARERGCLNVHLDSFSFQAPDFYKKLGYEEFAVLPDFPPGHSHHYFRKRLT
jgi:ribosomal protein S18 acetylase RimI-like enzyme